MPQYRLQVLLELREKAEEAAKEAFSVAVQAAEKEKKHLSALQEDLQQRKVSRKAKVQAFLEEVTQKGGGITGFQQMNRFEDRLRDEEAQVALEIERQKEVVEQAVALVEQRRLEMAEAAKEKKAIEKNKEAWQKQVRHERLQKEELSQEEIGNTLHLARARQERKS